MTARGAPQRMLWIPGGSGMLGSRLASDAVAAGHDVTATGHDVDITSAGAVARFLDEQRPDVVVNCAAYTAVDTAEREPEAAARLNSDGPRLLADACQARDIRLVHVSTDYVFDGDGTRPYREDDATAPVSVYGKSKRDGEVFVTDSGGLVVRTSWLYASTHKNFVRTMVKLMAEREQLQVVNDQRGRPTSVATLSAALLSLIDVNASGVVHVCDGGDAISWFDFATAIHERARAHGLPVKVTAIEPIPTSAYPTPAKRPAYSVLDTTRYTALTGNTLLPWQHQLDAVVRALTS